MRTVAPPKLRFTFGRHLAMASVEDALGIASLAAESIHGRPAMIMGTSVEFDAKRRSCVIDAGSDAGLALARVFAGLLERGYGERSFSVSHLAAPAREPQWT